MRRRPAARDAGFTLIELLVVIVIIGLAATAIVLSMPATGGSLEAEAERFAARARAARDAAIVDARSVRLSVSATGYRIARRSRGTWRTVEHRWSPATQVAPADARTIRFDPVGLAEPLNLSLQRGNRRVAVEIGYDGNIQVRR